MLRPIPPLPNQIPTQQQVVLFQCKYLQGNCAVVPAGLQLADMFRPVGRASWSRTQWQMLIGGAIVVRQMDMGQFRAE